MPIKHIERTLFFTKSYLPERLARKVIRCLDPTLLAHQEVYFPEYAPVSYSIDEEFSFKNLDLEEWQEFYMPVKAINSKVYNYMCSDLAAQSHGMQGVIISGSKPKNGRGIIEVVRDCLGSRILEENPDWTIRGKFGKINHQGKEWRTVAHSSTKDEADRDLELFKKWRIIH